MMKPHEVTELQLIVEKDRCYACKQELPPQREHVYAVRVRLNSGAAKWLYSEPTTLETATREGRDLESTGHKVRIMTAWEAECEQRDRAQKKGKQ